MSACKIDKIVLPGKGRPAFFVLMIGDRLYKEADEKLFVYSMNDYVSPIATYPLGVRCCEGIVSGNRLYIGGDFKLFVFEVKSSST